MVKEAEQFAEEDKKRRGAAEAKNNAESLIHSTERSSPSMATRSSAEVKTEIETALAEAKTAVEGGDADQMTAEDPCADAGGDEARPGDVRGSSSRAGAAPSGDAASRWRDAEAGAAPAEEEVVDAEFSEVDDENK